MKELDFQTVASWIIALMLAWFFFYNGWPKIVADEAVVMEFRDWGYSADFALVIGILEVLGALLVIFPPTALIGSVLLSLIMMGAIYTHLETGIGSPALAIFLLVLALVEIWLTRDRLGQLRRLGRRGQLSS